jgi:5'(3')-deoxyribonucleotidase
MKLVVNNADLLNLLHEKPNCLRNMAVKPIQGSTLTQATYAIEIHLDNCIITLTELACRNMWQLGVFFPFLMTIVLSGDKNNIGVTHLKS